MIAFGPATETNPLADNADFFHRIDWDPAAPKALRRSASGRLAARRPPAPCTVRWRQINGDLRRRRRQARALVAARPRMPASRRPAGSGLAGLSHATSYVLCWAIQTKKWLPCADRCGPQDESGFAGPIERGNRRVAGHARRDSRGPAARIARAAGNSPRCGPRAVARAGGPIVEGRFGNLRRPLFQDRSVRRRRSGDCPHAPRGDREGGRIVLAGGIVVRARSRLDRPARCGPRGVRAVDHRCQRCGRRARGSGS